MDPINDRDQINYFLSQLVQASIMTANEAREYKGQPKSTDPNDDGLWILKHREP